MTFCVCLFVYRSVSLHDRFCVCVPVCVSSVCVCIPDKSFLLALYFLSVFACLCLCLCMYVRLSVSVFVFLYLSLSPCISTAMFFNCLSFCILSFMFVFGVILFVHLLSSGLSVCLFECVHAWLTLHVQVDGQVYLGAGRHLTLVHTWVAESDCCDIQVPVLTVLGVEDLRICEGRIMAGV